MSCILLVDDNQGVRDVYSNLLESRGHQVVTVCEGKEALHALQAEGVDLVITDLFMDGMEGIETIREIRRRNPNVPILAMTGGPLGDIEMYLELALKCGANRAVVKPMSSVELMADVEAVLAKHRKPRTPLDGEKDRLRSASDDECAANH